MASTVSSAVSDRKAKEARWLKRSFYFVLGIILFDLVLRNCAPLFDMFRPGFYQKPFWDFYVAWEFASIASTFIVTIVYWSKYVGHDDDNVAYTDVFKHDDKKILTWLLVPLSALALISAAISAVIVAWLKDAVAAQVAWLVFEAACLCVGVFCLVIAEKKIIEAAPRAIEAVEQSIASQQKLLQLRADPQILAKLQEDLNKLSRKRADYIDIRDDIAKALSFSDAPIGVAFFLIFLLALVHWFGWTGAEGKLLSPFIAGAVALQLLYSNFVFYIEANGAFPDWARQFWPVLDDLTPMIQGRFNGSSCPDSQSTGPIATTTNQHPAVSKSNSE